VDGGLCEARPLVLGLFLPHTQRSATLMPGARMVQRVSTVAFEGIEARAVDVQVGVAPGLPAFIIVGLPDKAVSEARERVRGALVASGLALPARRIIVNLAPAVRLSARGYHRVLRVARTLADLDGAEHVGRMHLAEALSYRALIDEVRRAA
jgi:predicted ATPase with chaperone activity